MLIAAQQWQREIELSCNVTPILIAQLAGLATLLYCSRTETIGLNVLEVWMCTRLKYVLDSEMWSFLFILFIMKNHLGSTSSLVNSSSVVNNDKLACNMPNTFIQSETSDIVFYSLTWKLPTEEVTQYIHFISSLW